MFWGTDSVLQNILEHSSHSGTANIPHIHTECKKCSEIFSGIISVPQNIVMDRNNVMLDPTVMYTPSKTVQEWCSRPWNGSLGPWWCKLTFVSFFFFWVQLGPMRRITMDLGLQLGPWRRAARKSVGRTWSRWTSPISCTRWTSTKALSSTPPRPMPRSRSCFRRNTAGTSATSRPSSSGCARKGSCLPMPATSLRTGSTTMRIGLTLR